MQTSWLIIDGYNLIHKDPTSERYIRSGATPQALQHIVRKISEVGETLAPRCTIVFDGRGHKTKEFFENTRLEIIYAPANQTADTVIERMVYAHEQPEHIVVVTSDHAECTMIEAAGAQNMSCEAFLEYYDNAQQRTRNRTQNRQQQTKKPTLGDFFPDN